MSEKSQDDLLKEYKYVVIVDRSFSFWSTYFKAKVTIDNVADEILAAFKRGWGEYLEYEKVGDYINESIYLDCSYPIFKTKKEAQDFIETNRAQWKITLDNIKAEVPHNFWKAEYTELAGKFFPQKFNVKVIPNAIKGTAEAKGWGSTCGGVVATFDGKSWNCLPGFYKSFRDCENSIPSADYDSLGKSLVTLA